MTTPDPSGFDPILLSVLSSRIKSIIREMTNTVMRASRSSIIKNARDMSCGVLTYDNRLLSVEEALAIHVTALELTTQPIAELFDDVAEGDAFINNSPYLGVTHHADLTVCVPVFCDGIPLFWTLTRCHHADIGAPVPTTYLPYARDIYEEGLHFPCVRIQENYRDKSDIMRIALHKIRVSNVFHGDYLAQVGACRIGEKRLKELATQYGISIIRRFVEAWMAYGERRAIEAIRRLPAGTFTYTTRHDPVPGVADEGIPITAKVTVDPDAGLVTVDVRDNPDAVPGGLNLSEACAIAGCRIGVFYNLDPEMPHNHGSASRIVPLLRDGCVVGRPIYPVGTSCATSNCVERMANAVQCAFTRMGAPYGLAEGGGNFSAGLGVVSGIDNRFGEGTPYVTQLMVALSGGPALAGHDGWLTYEAVTGNGLMACDSIEVNEAMYPLLFEERRIATDTAGPGQWCGAPAVAGKYRALGGDVMVYYCNDGGTFPPNGVLGGLAAAPSGTWKKRADGVVERLPDFHHETFGPDETIVYRSCAGGGYGPPHARNPEEVRRDVERQWCSPQRARDIFGVAVIPAPDGIDCAVDVAATVALRAALQS